MIIEGDHLRFSSGLLLYAPTLNTRDIEINKLTDQEKWELSRSMIDRWMTVRDKLWEAREKTLTSLIGEVLGEDVQDRTDSSPFPVVDSKLGGKDSRPDLLKRECSHNTCGSTCEREAPVFEGAGSFPCRCQVVPVGKLLEEAELPLWDGVNEYPTLNDGPKCHDTSCFEHDDDYKDGCHLTTTERDKCDTWKATIAEKEKAVKEDGGLSCDLAICNDYNEIYSDNCERVTARRDKCPSWKRVVATKEAETPEDYSCPVVSCVYILEGTCTYMIPKDCGIKLNYINSIEVARNLKKKEVNYLHADIDHLKVGTKTGWGQEA